ncbi:HI0074 family nucleotidyltransferase substrate-binding subunit [Salipaludibacillus sp. HK11]|uniref:HI0074 family nucleotidyltransferase substrate-binding subunit n=1 Tax=Salipaludibacillus sp. HK11 TaxID=3394320 RepID=UPI0039FBE5C0
MDGTIHRFEFTIELYWKTLKRVLLSEGIEANTPKEILKGAFQAGWLENEEAWLQMLKDKNLTSHTYVEESALLIVHNIKDYFPEMKATFYKINSRVNGSDD